MPRTISDYYTVSIPGDASDSLEDIASMAIDEARERARLYAIPCEWTACHVSGEIGEWEVKFRVRRRRLARKDT